MARSTSRPVTFGSFKSSIITRGPLSIERFEYRPWQKTKSNACSPSVTWTMLLASFCLRSARIVNSASAGSSSTRSISTSLNSSVIILYSSRQCEVERRTPSDLSLGPDTATVPVDDSLHDSQSDAGTFKFVPGMQPLEHSKQLVHIFRDRTPPRCHGHSTSRIRLQYSPPPPLGAPLNAH